MFQPSCLFHSAVEFSKTDSIKSCPFAGQNILGKRLIVKGALWKVLEAHSFPTFRGNVFALKKNTSIVMTLTPFCSARSSRFEASNFQNGVTV